MKIIGCYVRNFGTLKDFEYHFTDGLTVIKEDNGFGKSTLAAFIKAMFYGFPKRSGHSIETNERMKFTPWQGGIFGGSLDFEVGGKKYRVERTFGAREKEDTFKLFDLELQNQSGDYSSELGVELFAMDADSFERSVYASQSSIETGMTDSLSAGLTGLIENNDDIGNFESALKVLEKQAKFYSVSNGARGEIADKTRQIESLRRQINDMSVSVENVRDREKSLTELSETAEALERKLVTVRQKITAASDKAARDGLKKQREELAAEINSLETAVWDINSKYTAGFPTEREMAQYRNADAVLKEAEVRASVFGSDEISDRKGLDRLKEFFEAGVPTEDEIKKYTNVAAEIRSLEIKTEMLREQEALLPKAHGKGGHNGVSFKINLGFAAVLTVLGAVVLLKSTTVGVILLVLGLIDLGAAAFIYLKNMIASGSGQAERSTLQSELEAANSKKTELKQQLAEFTEKYMPEESPLTAFDTVEEAFRDLKSVEAAVKKAESKESEYFQRVAQCRITAEQFMMRYGLRATNGETDSLAVITRDMADHERFCNELAVKRTRLAQMPTDDENGDIGIAESREELLESERQTVAELDSVQKRITQLKLEIDRMAISVESLSDLEERLDDLTSERDEMAENLNILNLTAEFLKSAKADLSTRYLDKVIERFRYYCGVLDGQPREVLVDAELNVQTSVDGAAREKSYFSQGVRDMTDIAMRLSLNDALFGDESVFMILDDPFVNLDDTRLKNAKELLKKLALNRQIVYLTCHSSRC